MPIDLSSKLTLTADSQVVHGYQGHDPYTGAVSFPIYQTSTYRHAGLGEGGYDYSRVQNPTREELENTIALLENGRYGYAFSSGLAAVTAVFSLLGSGDHVLISDDLYGGTYRLVEYLWKKFGVDFTYADMSDMAVVRANLLPNTRMIFVETPTNPMMKVCDIAAVAAISREKGTVLVVDNTFLTPYFQKPLSLGADIVLHSGTKFLCGHHDTMCGFIALCNDKLAEQMRLILKTEGTGLSPFDSWLTLRGIKTLALRMRKHEENAFALAHWLEHCPRVEKVYYAGLESHESYAISRRQSTGFGGMLSFTVTDPSKINEIIGRLRLVMFAESLGGVESLITYPLTQTHASIPKEIRERVGITDKLLRLSVGIESDIDIINDLEYALSY